MKKEQQNTKATKQRLNYLLFLVFNVCFMGGIHAQGVTITVNG